ncbi:MAG: thioredoxin-disulfide reductase [Lachnospiraceae bacterium]|nr:thioredoxin-disulfide reductase [Lachnospiraceae bacterium]
MRDVIIVGSGPAGMGAAIYGKRAGLDTLVLEGSGMSGGQVTQTYEVDNYLGLPGVNGFDMAMTFQAHMEKLGAEFEMGYVTKIEKKENYFEVITEEKTYKTKTVILATGASHNKLMVPGEEELAGMGVSYCATCDGAFFRGRTTMVVGGGDVAIEDAIFLARGCEKVYLVHRRDELRGAKILQDSLMSLENVEIIWDSVVESIEGEEQVEQVKLLNRKTGERSEIKTDGIFIAVGIHPNTESFVGLVEMDVNGYIVAGENCETSVPGIFVAGDTRTKELRQIITAVADGANAVNSVQRYLISL